MIAALVQGDLTSDPVQRVASNGSPYWTTTVRASAGAEALLVGVSTFSETAGIRLMQLNKGAAVAVVGKLEATTWTAKDGSERQGWRIHASEVLTTYSATKRRKASEVEEDAV